MLQMLLADVALLLLDKSLVRRQEEENQPSGTGSVKSDGQVSVKPDYILVHRITSRGGSLHGFTAIIA